MTARSKPPFEADIIGAFSSSEELVEIISIEAAKPKIQSVSLAAFPLEKFMLSVLILGNAEIEKRELIAERI